MFACRNARPLHQLLSNLHGIRPFLVFMLLYIIASSPSNFLFSLQTKRGILDKSRIEEE